MSADRPGLNAFLDAYVTLGVEYGASPLDIRKAFKDQVRAHHPDRFPSGSSEQREATGRMAAVNAAYRLIHNAPLRYHRVSTGSRPDDAWTHDELHAAVMRAQREAALSRIAAGALSTLGVALYWFGPGRLLGWHPTNVFAGFLVLIAAFVLAAQTHTGLVLWRVIHLFGLVRPVLADLNRLTR